MFFYVTDREGEGNYIPLDAARIVVLTEEQNEELDAGAEIHQLDFDVVCEFDTQVNVTTPESTSIYAHFAGDEGSRIDIATVQED